MTSRQQLCLFSDGRPGSSGRSSGVVRTALEQRSSGIPVGVPDGRPLDFRSDDGRPIPSGTGEIPPPPEMRPYQLDALAAIERAQAEKKRSTLLVLATGLGKTVIAAERIRRRVEANRLLFLAHREELIEQTANKLRDARVNASIEMASRKASLSSRVVVASVQSLQGRRLLRFPRGHFDEIIIDEAHHGAAKSYRNILAHFDGAFVFGLTATPDRADGKSLADMFESVAYRYELREAIADGWLAPIVARRVVVEGVDLRGVSKVAGDFNVAELDAIMGAEKVLHRTCAPLVELAGSRPTILFAVSVAHAHQLAELLSTRYGRTAVALDGSTDKSDRRLALQAFARREFQYLVNCALFTEGFDSPGIECVAVARPTMSRALYTQMIGRGTRKAPGKTSCLVLDFVGNSRHSLRGPADALAGSGADLSPEMRAEIEALLSADAADVGSAMSAAEERLHAKATSVSVLAVAAYRASQVDPFLGEQLPSHVLSGGGALTEAMRQALKLELGMAKPPDTLTMFEAQSWIDAAKKRKRAGLATFKQCSALRRANIDEAQLRRMPVARANELISMLAAADWRPSALAAVPERKGAIR